MALAPRSGLIAAACAALGLSRASLHRRECARKQPPARARPKPPRALTDAEQQHILEMLRGPRFVDLAPAEIYACLLDEGVYLCSIRTMYRLLAEHGEIRERRRQLRHPAYQKPELLATGPNQVWSWDLTKLMGPVKWTYFYLYVIPDILLVQHRFCKFPTGWFCAATRPRRTSPAGDFFGVFFPTSTKESTTWHNA